MVGSGAASAGCRPTTRSDWPSMRRVPCKGWGRPVQWVVSQSVSRSAGDQMLKYGSCATSGTAGARKSTGCANAALLVNNHTRKVCRMIGSSKHTPYRPSSDIDYRDCRVGRHHASHARRRFESRQRRRGSSRRRRAGPVDSGASSLQSPGTVEHWSPSHVARPEPLRTAGTRRPIACATPTRRSCGSWPTQWRPSPPTRLNGQSGGTVAAAQRPRLGPPDGVDQRDPLARNGRGRRIDAAHAAPLGASLRNANCGGRSISGGTCPAT